MANLILNGSTSGSVTLSSPAVSGTTTLTLPTTSGTVSTTTNPTDMTINGVTVGKGAGAVSTNTVVGVSALAANSTGLRVTAVGNQALLNNTASENTAIGARAMLTNTSGTNNTAVGRDSMYFNTTGGENSALGLNSLVSNTTGSNNTAIGRDALQANTTASNNTAVGYQAGLNITTGFSNTVLGRGALTSMTTGSYNIAIGETANNFGTTGSYTTALGYNAYPNAATDSYCFMIGAAGGTQGKGSNTGILNVYNGSSYGGIYQGNNSSSWATTSDQRLKKNIIDNNQGLDLISQIKVRNFEYRLPEEITELPEINAIKIQGVQLGVIAQEIQQILPDCITQESSGVLSVNNDSLTWYLINAVKELKTELDAIKSELATIKGTV
jgi:hypothetical protein